MFNLLFSPIRINKLEIKNRIAYPGLALLYSYDGKLNDRYEHYFREKARGGAGIVTVGPVAVDFLAAGHAALSLAHNDAIPAFRKLAALIKREGARAWIQLHHGGAYAFPLFLDGKEPIAPSAIFSRFSGVTPREMTIDDIRYVQEAFAGTAQRAQEAGFDGVEILGSAGYLITQFLSPLKNRRTDAYGGSFENRTLFVRELLELVRRRLGDNYPLTIRMAGNDFIPGSNTDAETPLIAKVYENSSIDAINVTGGWHESNVPQLPMEMPRQAYAYLASTIKKAVSVPVMASNRITTPGDAETLLREGYADMVNLGRVLIADPYWPEKARQNKAEEIRPCVACSQGCMDQIFSGMPLFCITNPRAGLEAERTISKAANPKKVMVVGSGVGGLEAAVTAAAIGHTVELYEKKSDIGGQLNIAAAPPGKQELLEILRYYQAMISKYGVRVHLNMEVTSESVLNKKPDYIIIAEGAEASTPPITGVNDAKVITSWQVLEDNPPLGNNVGIIGGGSVGLETALFVAARGTISAEVLNFLFTYEAESTDRLRELLFQGTSRVTVFEMLPKMGVDMGKSSRWVMMANLKRHGVTMITGAKVAAITGGEITYEKEGCLKHIQFDQVILATGSKSVRRLSQEVAQLDIPMTTIGDGKAPGKINDAIHGGFLAALNIP